METATSLQRRLGRGLLWNYAGRVAEFGLRFVLFTLLARGLGDTGYGSYSFVMSVFGIATLLAGLGLEQALNTFTAQWQARPAELRYLLRAALGLRAAALAVLVLAIWFLAGPLAGRVGISLAAIRAMLLYFAGYNLYNLLLYYLIGRLAAGFAAALRAVVIAANVVLVAWLLGRGAGIAGILLAQGFTALLALLATLWWIRKDLAGPRTRAPLGRPLRFAGVLGLTTGLNFVLGQQSDVFLLGLLLRDRAQIGEYNLAAGLNFMLSTLLLIGFEGVSQSAFSEVAAQDAGRLAALWSTLLKLVTALSLPVLLFGALHAHRLVGLYGDAYAPSVPLLRVYLLFSLAGRLLGGGLNTTVLYALGREWLPLRIRTVGGIANLVLAIGLIGRLGPMGAVLATGIAVLGAGLVETIVTMRATGARYPWRFAAKVALATVVAAALSYPLTRGSWLGLLGGATVMVCALLGAFAVLRPLEAGERAMAVELMPRLAPLLRYF